MAIFDQDGTIIAQGIKSKAGIPVKTIYSDLRTPFFEITIIDGSNKSTKRVLPPQILKLVERIEISEVYGECCFHPLTITVVFGEGSREPFNHLLTNAASDQVSSLYGSPLSNTAGFLTDLKFGTDNAGITALADLAPPIGLPDQNFSDTINPVNTSSAISSSDKFLFHEGNILKVTWGYLNDNGTNTINSRTVAGIITVIHADFPEQDHPTFTVITQPLTSVFDQITPIKGRQYSTEKLMGTSLSGKDLTVFEDMTISEVIKDISDNFGLGEPQLSDNLLNPVLDKHHVKNWVAGQSLHAFLTELAMLSTAYYTTEYNPTDDKEYISFKSRADTEKQAKLSPTLFAYKNPGSILKSVSLKADFGMITTSSFVGLDIDGNSTIYKAEHGGTSKVVFPGYQVVKATANQGTVSSQLVAAMPAGISSGETNLHPAVDSPATAEDMSTSKAGKMDNLIFIEFESLGHPILAAGKTIYLSRIGRRYSSYYKLQQVTHSIDNNGYTCHGQLVTNLVASAGGVADKDTEGEVQEQTESQIVQPS